MTDQPSYDAVIATYDPATVRSMSKDQAGEALARLSGVYADANARPVVDKPATAVQAYDKLMALQKDAKWVEKFERGSPECRKTFDDLTRLIAEGGDAEFAKAGIVPDGHIDTGGPGRPPLRDQIAAVRDMMGRGWAPSAIDDIISDKKPTLVEHQNGKRALAAFMADSQCVAALNAGSREAQWLHRDLCWAVGCYEPIAA